MSTITRRRKSSPNVKWQKFLTIIRVVIQLGTFFLVPVILFRVWYSVIKYEPPLNIIAWAIMLVAVVVVNRFSSE